MILGHDMPPSVGGSDVDPIPGLGRFAPPIREPAMPDAGVASGSGSGDFWVSALYPKMFERDTRKVLILLGIAVAETLWISEAW
jgi:hypothetical protein